MSKEEFDFTQAKQGASIPIAPNKTRITIRLDTDVLNWFRNQVHAQSGDMVGGLILFLVPPVPLLRHPFFASSSSFCIWCLICGHLSTTKPLRWLFSVLRWLNFCAKWSREELAILNDECRAPSPRRDQMRSCHVLVQLMTEAGCIPFFDVNEG